MPSTINKYITIGVGTRGDYEALKGFHYREGRPGAVMRVFAARYVGPEFPRFLREGVGGAGGGMLAGVIVESLPALACALRRVALPGVFEVGDRSLAAAKLNREMRTISRVIVHPIFRGAGVAVGLVRHLLERAETPYIEALAAMGRVHPFFKRAGMREYDRPPLAGAVRLMAALEREGLRAVDLVDGCGGGTGDAIAGFMGGRIDVTGFLRRELERFTRMPAGTPVEVMMAKARHGVLSQPVYYLWSGATLPRSHEAHEDPRKNS